MTTPKLYTLLKIPLRELINNDFYLQLSKEEQYAFRIAQQDNQLFRQIRLITGDKSDFNRWIVFVNCNGISNKEEPVSKIIHDGFRINNQHFVLSERSASMTRNSILSFVDDHIIDELNERVLMGIRTDKTVLSKYYAYRGLTLSSCHCIEGWYPKVVIVPDYEVVFKNQHIKCLYDKEIEYTDENGTHPWKQKDVMETHRDLKANLFDGCGIHHPAITQYIRGVLNIRENPTSLLLRMPYIKGVTHEMDYPAFFQEHGVSKIVDIWGHEHSVTPDAEPMFIMTESMYKGFKYFKGDGTYADWEYYWEQFKKYDHCVGITKWNFSKEREPVYTRSNYQILQDLNMPFEDFAELAEDSVEWAEKIVNGDPLYTYCFLGLMADKHDGLNSYCKAILKNPVMLQEESVKKYVRQSIAKYRDEFKCGKLWLHGCFKFLAPDLVMLMQHIGGLERTGCLEADEFYSHDTNGDMHGERSIERNPHICASEHIILNAVTNELTHWVQHLDNVCMLNCKSIVNARLQGADKQHCPYVQECA